MEGSLIRRRSECTAAGAETRDLAAQFYGFTERGVEVLHEQKYLHGLPVARALYENTRKTEKIERHESAPCPELPDAVAEALEFDEPELNAVDGGTIRQIDDS